MTAVEVREEVLSWMKNYPDGYYVPGSGERGTVIGLMNKALRLSDHMYESNMRRHQVLAWLFRDALLKPYASFISSKELTDQMWWCLCKYTEARKDPDVGEWVGRSDFADAMCVCWQAMEAWDREMTGQLGFPDML